MINFNKKFNHFNKRYFLKYFLVNFYQDCNK